MQTLTICIIGFPTVYMAVALTAFFILRVERWHNITEELESRGEFSRVRYTVVAYAVAILVACLWPWLLYVAGKEKLAKIKAGKSQ